VTDFALAEPEDKQGFGWWTWIMMGMRRFVSQQMLSSCSRPGQCHFRRAQRQL